jgi:hypothetical protein
MLHTSYPALPSSVAVARDLVASVAERGGASEEQVERVRLAVSEVLTNAVEQDYIDSAGEVHVKATVVDGQLAVVIANDACENRRMGFGLTVIAACSDHFMVGATPSGGVRVEMHFDLGSADHAVDPIVAFAPAP